MGDAAPVRCERTCKADRSPIDLLNDLVAEEMQAIDQLIYERMVSQAPMIPQLATHLIAAGGKRLRPMLTVAAAKLCGYTGDHHIKLATTIEFVHSATLLHDDVVDGSDQRRGKKAANLLWGNKPTILVGDYLFSRAFQLMVEAESLPVLDVLANASAVIAEGEVMQLATANNLSTTMEQYLAVIRSKTAALFSASAEVGGMIAKATPEQQAGLRVYGDCLGIAFQLVDDILDYAGTAKIGKNIGDDFREGKVTQPLMHAYARANAEEQVFWKRVIEYRDQKEGDLTEALRLIDKYDGIKAAQQQAESYAQQAKAALAPLPNTAIRSAMSDVVDFVLKRAY